MLALDTEVVRVEFVGLGYAFEERTCCFFEILGLSEYGERGGVVSRWDFAHDF